MQARNKRVHPQSPRPQPSPIKGLICAAAAASLVTAMPTFGQMTDAIANAVTRGNFVYIYNSKGSQLCVIAAGDGLTGYTASSVNIKRGNFIYTFDAKGRQTSVTPAGN